MSGSVPCSKVRVTVTWPADEDCGREIAQVVDALQLLLDDLRGRLVERRRVGARIDGGDR